MKKKGLTTLLIILPMLVVTIAVPHETDRIFAVSSLDNHESHNGFHYSANSNSFISNGNNEFWTCCSCHKMFLEKPSGSFIDKDKYDYSLENTEAYIPSDGRTIGNQTNGVVSSVNLPGYAFTVYECSGLAQQFLFDNINISRYEKLSFAVKSESLWFIVQDPTWEKPLEPNKWYQIDLVQSETNSWEIYKGDLGGNLSLHASTTGSNLKSVVSLGSDNGKFYITDFLISYKKEDAVGDLVDNYLYSANGMSMNQTYEAIPTGFSQVHVTNVKKSPGDYFHGMYYSAVDLSSYTKVRFAIKTIGYFLLNHSWNSNIVGTNDWLIFELTKTATYQWNLIVTNYNGETVYTENNLNGDMGSSPDEYTSNSLNAILYGACNGFFACKNNAYDLKVYSTEIRAYKSLIIDTSYSIIYDKNDKNASKAAEDLMYYFGLVSDWKFYFKPKEATDEIYSNSSKIISIGNTSFAESAGVIADESLGTAGYIVKTKGQSVIINAYYGLGNTAGTRYFMETVFGFDCFSYTDTDVVSTYNKMQNIEIVSLNKTYVPSIWNRQITTNTKTLAGGHNMSLGYSFDMNGAGSVTSDVHTLGDFFLSYETYESDHWRWYSKSGSDIQLCYSARGNDGEYTAMKNQLVNEITPLVASFDGSTCYVNLTIKDNWHQCECLSCKKDIKTYGTYSGQIMHFVSEVADLVDDWVKINAPNKVVKYIFLTYQQAQDAPSSIPYILNKNVIAYYAPPKADFSKGFSSTENATYYNQMVGWSNLFKSQNMKNNLRFWAYSTPAYCYMLPFNDYEQTQNLIKTLSSLGFTFMHVEMPYITRIPCFEDLNIYVKGKLMNDVTQNYDDIVNKFMTHYYGAASTNMKTYYNYIKSIIQTNVDGVLFTDANQKEYWKIDDIKTMLTTLDKCLDDVSSVPDLSLKEALEGRIHRERITPIFLLMDHYVNSHTYTKEEMQCLLEEFKTYSKKYSITNYNYNTDLSEKISSYTSSVNALSY